MSELYSTFANQSVKCVKCVNESDNACLKHAPSDCSLRSSYHMNFDNKGSNGMDYTSNRNSSSSNTGNTNDNSSCNNTTIESQGFGKLPSSETSTHMTHMTQACLLEQQLPLLSILKEGFVCFDFEWASCPDSNGEQKFRAASFVDSNGAKKTLLIEDYERQFGDKAEYALLIEIVNYLSKYDYCFGWYSSGVEAYDEIKQRKKGKNSDLVVLDKRLKANGLSSSSSVVSYTQSGIPYLIRTFGDIQ